jgi:iron complex outermembrane receptor protein
VVRNHDESSDDKLTSWGWNSKLKLGGWTFAADLSGSKNKKLNSRYETTAGQPGNANLPGFAGNVGTISWTGFDGSNFEQVRYTTSLDYSNPAVAKLTDVMGWSGGATSPQAGYVALPTVIDSIKATRLSGKTPMTFGPVTELELGVNFTQREKTRSADEGRLVIKDSVNLTTGAVLNPYAALDVPGAGVAVAGTTGLRVISWNPTGSLGTIYDLPPKVDKDILNKSWEVTEDVTTAYARAGLDTKLFGFDVRGNAGVQFVNTDQSGSGYLVNEATCTGNTPATCPSTRVVRGASYTDVLPSLSLNFDIGNDSVVRMALSRTLSRPTMADLRGSRGFGVSVVTPPANSPPGTPSLRIYTGSEGNPALEPFRATSLDLTYEKYFGNKAYFAVAGFAKDLSTYIYKQVRPFDFRTLGVTLTDPTVDPMGFMTSPANGTGGKLSGLEFTASLPFNMLFKPADGFGVQFNYSYTDSSVAIPLAGLNTNDVNILNLPLPGLSRHNANLRFYYEKHGLQVSVAQRYRSDFLGEISDFQDNRQLTMVKAESTVDAQISYEFQSGPAKGLTILFQGNNLTKTAFQRFRPDTGAVVENVPSGKTYLLGINYKL